jgi:hypothetical protein
MEIRMSTSNVNVPNTTIAYFDSTGLTVSSNILNAPYNSKLSLTTTADQYVNVSSVVAFNTLNVGCTDYYREWNSTNYTFTPRYSGLYYFNCHLGGVVIPFGQYATLELTGITNGAGSNLESRITNVSPDTDSVFALNVSRIAYITAGNTVKATLFSSTDPLNTRIYSSTQWADFTVMRIP